MLYRALQIPSNIGPEIIKHLKFLTEDLTNAYAYKNGYFALNYLAGCQ
ncbi:MAG: hypothetical protein EZS28_022797, partial [Streblomastix strix]